MEITRNDNKIGNEEERDSRPRQSPAKTMAMTLISTHPSTTRHRDATTEL